VLGEDLAGAARSFGLAIETATDAGMSSDVAVTQSNLGELLVQIGEPKAAASHQRACLEAARSSGMPVLVAFSVIVAAHLCATTGDWERAVRLHRAGTRQLEELSYVMYDVDAERSAQLDAAARSAMGDAAFELAAGEGTAMSFDDAADAAAAELDRFANDLDDELRQRTSTTTGASMDTTDHEGGAR
jgi:hypothetical protein